MSHDPTQSPTEGTPVTPLPQAPPPPTVKSSKLILTMAGFSAVAALLIVVAFQSTQPRILKNKAAVLQAAIGEVLAEPKTVKTVFVYQGKLVDALPAGVDSAGLDRVYLGLDEAGKPRGFAVTAGGPGFSDVVNLIFGYEPGTGTILGMKVLEEKDTPGLGDKIEKDTGFVNGFDDVLTPIQGIKRTVAKTDPHQLDMITGATISSRAVIKAINNRLETIGPLLKGYRYGGGA